MAFPFLALAIGGATYFGLQSANQQQQAANDAAELQALQNRIDVLDREEQAEREYLRQSSSLKAFYAASGGGSGPLNAANSQLSQRLAQAQEGADLGRLYTQAGLSQEIYGNQVAKDGAVIRTVFAAGQSVAGAYGGGGDGGSDGGAAGGSAGGSAGGGLWSIFG